MLFNDPIFIFVFLPVFVLAFYTTKRINPELIFPVMFLFSLLFYWGGGSGNPLVLVTSIAVNYTVGVLIAKSVTSTTRWWLLIVGVGFNLAYLFYFKYMNFFAAEIAHLFNTQFDALYIILPLAISFFTFQQISFLVDLHARRISLPKLLEFCAYVSFFPQLIAGPIVRFSEIHEQFVASAAKKTNKFWSNLAIGLAIFAVGLTKKVLTPWPNSRTQCFSPPPTARRLPRSTPGSVCSRSAFRSISIFPAIPTWR